MWQLFPDHKTAAWPVVAALRVFPEEFEHYIKHGKSMVTTEPMLAMAP